jgi:membrane-associated protease RseP (regulator of RpoE activity)
LRKLLGLVAVLVASPAAANESSNPAFLGVGMHDMAGAPGMGPCVIDTVTKDSGAHLAGIRPNDILVSIDTTSIANCDALVLAIQQHEPGVNVKIEVKRSGLPVTLEALLPSRADVLRKRFVGKPMPLQTSDGHPIKLVRVDDQSVGDLASRGKTTVIGWFDQTRCAGCASAFATIQQWVKSKGSKNTITVLGVTGAQNKSVPETVQDLKQVQRSFDVPLLVADSETFGDLSITDIKRIHFLVIDSRGIVCYATPLKPDADDKDAVLGELYAATENAARRTK